jgi:hypothetical protein
MTAILLASTLAILFVGITNNMAMVYAGDNSDEEESEEEETNEYQECAEKYPIGTEGYYSCTGGIGIPGTR